jgi:UDP-N-acetylglucosamine/UDP-N-acetylgalactosamine diphosphorylase
VADPTREQLRALRGQFAAHGQAHVFAFWDTLNDVQRSALFDQACVIGPDLEALLSGQAAAISGLSAPSPGRIEPAATVPLPEFGGDPAAFAAAEATGLEVLKSGRVGVFVVAGGQGSRLGFEGPKGAYPVGPVTERSLFEIQAQKIRGVSRRSGVRVPWYVMTSAATDSATRALFAESNYFGLPAEDVFIFSQAMVPACGLDGRLILERPDRIFESPNGHGGALLALASSGALDDMRARGIDRLFYYQVDNPLIEMADPVFLGFHESMGSEMSCKVIRKADPMEKVGIVADVEGVTCMVEYTELGDTERHMRDESGQLVHWAGNIAIHVFNTDFVRRVAERADALLPYHASAKIIPSVDENGAPVDGSEPNGYKLERFVFDALPAAARTCILEVRAREEFAPIKNRSGTDSPETARSALMTLYREWLTGMGLEPLDANARVEIDHALIDSAKEAAASGIKSLEDAGNAIRFATGMEA